MEDAEYIKVWGKCEEVGARWGKWCWEADCQGVSDLPPVCDLFVTPSFVYCFVGA